MGRGPRPLQVGPGRPGVSPSDFDSSFVTLSSSKTSSPFLFLRLLACLSICLSALGHSFIPFFIISTALSLSPVGDSEGSFSSFNHLSFPSFLLLFGSWT
ncbi:hypothetical protein HRR80_005536 [Exophiala dermatitidis]|uniref:Transmembrane protein n=1 Tax=Exophiala dermatitidis TaxID=5970 RepID=A0AAN6EUW0_EXODE|nr:hypothetical protein HRR79_008797 [Exophiala dermatitidis]KAJ4568697.1 hypothetical protein HRR82_007932 [Exophiala dermatitidis]KAJ8990761.1 hypothetical protein HRR80_005536 [Exophiala dermatitidis]